MRGAELTKPLPHSKPLENFIKAFDGYVEPSQRKFHRPSRVETEWYNSDMDVFESYQIRMETVDGVAIHIPIHKLEDFVGSIPEQHWKEMQIRMQVPAVKLAYERYRMLLKMCGGDFDAGY